MTDNDPVAAPLLMMMHMNVIPPLLAIEQEMWNQSFSAGGAAAAAGAIL